MVQPAEPVRLRVAAAAAEDEARPWLTWIIIALNLAVFAGEVLAAGTANALMSVPAGATLAFGGNYASATLREGRVETLLTACFVHGGLLHIAFNMYALKQVLPFLERSVGIGRSATLYLVSGIVGGMCSSIFGWIQGQRLGVGASGAICGLIGAAMVVGWRTQGRQSPLMKAMAKWLGTVLLIGLLPGFDNAAHAGGGVAGALVALTWRRGPELPASRAANLALFAIVLALSGARVVQQDLTNPYATLGVNERLAVAGKALMDGDCNTAREAMAAARRVAPRAPDVLHDAQLVRRECGETAEDHTLR